MFSHSLGEEHPLGNHVFTQCCSLRRKKNQIENAQFNTMLCKGKMKFHGVEKKMVGNRWRGVPPLARILRGRAPGETDLLYHNLGRRQQKDDRIPVLGTPGHVHHLAATELTAMVSPSRTPVTVAFLPACWPRGARVALSVVSKV